MQRLWHLTPILFLLALLGLAGCDTPLPPVSSGPPPVPAIRPDPVLQVAPPSRLSEATREYYAQLQSSLLAQGLLRTDRGGPDTPFTDRNLAENFIRIALFDEYATQNGQFVQRQTPSHLRRWTKPVRMAVEFGDTVQLAQRSRDIASVAGYAAELAQATGHPVSLVTDAANFHVLILSEDDRRAAGARLSALVPGISAGDLATVIDMPRETYCLVFAYSGNSASTYDSAVAVIRSEHPDLLRQSCLQEELAQGLGLANDSPDARPSIFNDDEEFALLTLQDRLLLHMLYDARLRPGMTPEQATPIVREIAEEMIYGGS
jgi:Protein of unknown function (DUF2927)